MYLEPTHGQMAAWIRQTPSDQPVDMLNLLRFRETADYSATPELAPEGPVSGADAYRAYEVHTLPFLLAAGGSLVYAGSGRAPVIGPTTERWDRVLIVRHRSVGAFLEFARNEAYLAGLGHRLAALEDSRLVPMALASSAADGR